MTKFKIGEKVKFKNWLFLPDSEKPYQNRIGTIIERNPYEITVKYKDGYVITNPLHFFNYADQTTKHFALFAPTNKSLYDERERNKRKKLIDNDDLIVIEPNEDYENRKRKLKKSKSKRLVKKKFKKSFKKSFKK